MYIEEVLARGRTIVEPTGMGERQSITHLGDRGFHRKTVMGCHDGTRTFSATPARWRDVLVRSNHARLSDSCNIIHVPKWTVRRGVPVRSANLAYCIL